MALRSTKTHNNTLKKVAPFTPKLCDSLSTNQVARSGREQCYRIFYSNDAVDYILSEVASAGS